MGIAARCAESLDRAINPDGFIGDNIGILCLDFKRNKGAYTACLAFGYCGGFSNEISVFFPRDKAIYPRLTRGVIG